MITRKRASYFIRQFGGPGEDTQKAGWPIRFRLDPMILYPDWKRAMARRSVECPLARNGYFGFLAGNRLKANIKPALCKEDRALWEGLGYALPGKPLPILA
jgi:hypothetical protein